MENTVENAPEKKGTNKKFTIILAALVIFGGAYGGYKYMHGQAHETTDDAQVEKNMSPIIPRVGGFISKVYVKDNDLVKKGDTLFTIESQDYQVRVDEALAALAAAQSSFDVSKADVSASSANVAISDATIQSNLGSIDAARIRAKQANNDYIRYQNLYNNQSITKQQYEQALTAKLEADKQVEILQQQRNASASQRNAIVSKTTVAAKQTSVAEANIKRANAQLEAAKLNLSYTAVLASVDGQVSNIKVQPGQMVNPGQSLFYIVDNIETWVVANFKETQLEKMKPGQKVGIKVDAYPNIEFEGEVNSFSPATGSRFSLLPPDNATGNFVKTVQRLPVKIKLTKDNKAENVALLRPGMNADVDVHVQ
ncbi:HlyD family secretion protein [Sphingobacterium multivorum]|jgi:membrane fusion protein (multidrug efflux system)|uniref:HlyD family secretion protein n=1 Tax=Sphingobacterium TaxID=28453 RepID=UPI002834134A|nr:HlyD family secretion protein [Sphingobacterium sp. UGAL515B_05]MDR2272905.1 HlyD family secretion protein [Sphingobacterium sp.]WON93034.1 HlyD family secretion protein [Sphingobacterium sp. UGAL515B_05]